MKKIIVCIIAFLILLSLNSCTLLKIIFTVDTISKSNDEDDYSGNVKIYIENKTKEIIVVYTNVYLKGIELARIPIGRVQTINIRKGSTIYICGGNTNTKYLEIICDKDNETYLIY